MRFAGTSTQHKKIKWKPHTLFQTS
jgi:hypothetical protein